HGLEPTPHQATRSPSRKCSRRRFSVFCPLVLSSTGRPRDHCHDDGLRQYGVRLQRLAAQRVCHPISSGEKPGHWSSHSGQFRSSRRSCPAPSTQHSTPILICLSFLPLTSKAADVCVSIKAIWTAPQ